MPVVEVEPNRIVSCFSADLCTDTSHQNLRQLHQV
jgi:hypothetical protein